MLPLLWPCEKAREEYYATHITRGVFGINISIDEF
jgi:hypothetical protein